MQKEIRRPSFLQALMPIIFMTFALIIGKGVLNWPTEICLLLSAVFAGLVAVVCLGYNWEMLEKLIVDKIAAVMPPVLIVIFVGFMVAAWCYSGTLPMLVYYGIKLIDPKLIFMIAFVSTAILSYVSGASWGAAASIGVALMGVGVGLNVSPAIMAAAVVTGAYFGDKLSPLSDTTNLAAAVTKVPLYDHIKYMLWTTVPPTIISLIFYGIVGLNLDVSQGVSEESNALLTQLQSLYKFGFLPLLPMIAVLAGTFLRMPTVPVMLASSVVAIFVGGMYQGFDWIHGVRSTMSGFDVSMLGVDTSILLPSVTELLNRGGLSNQGGFLAFIFCAMGFAGIVTGTGMMDVAMSRLTKSIRTCISAVITTEIQCVMINLLTGSDGLNKIITTNLMMKKFLQLRIHPIVLARTLEDSGTMTGPLIPWSAAGLYMATTLGVATIDYLPYCILSFCCLLLAPLYAFLDFKIIKLTDEQAYAMAAERGIVLDKE
ncbi:transporter IbgT [Gammaproteobacteria bacterium]|nr:transporter IbgT [Gammaproteobacteria bacterium]